MDWRFPLLAVSLTASCGPAQPGPALNAQQLSDARVVAYYARDPCTWREIDPRFGTDIRTLRFASPGDCLAMEPARVMRGVWFTGFEESGFIPDVETVALRRVFSRNSVNLEFDIDLRIDRDEADRVYRRRGPGSRAVRVLFVGRRSLPYRRLDGGPGMPIVVVDRLLWAQDLGEVVTRFNCRDFDAPGNTELPCVPGTEVEQRR